MHGARNQPRCGVCENKLVKNGKTSAGRTRWRCKNCGASSTKQRPDIARRAEFEAFMAWLSSSAGLNELGVSIATFRHRTSWCWNVAPAVVPTGEIHHQIMLDGTYFNGWCVLIAHTHTQPDQPIGPAKYDTGFTYEDGIKLRQGWAGEHP